MRLEIQVRKNSPGGTSWKMYATVLLNFWDVQNRLSKTLQLERQLVFPLSLLEMVLRCVNSSSVAVMKYSDQSYLQEKGLTAAPEGKSPSCQGEYSGSSTRPIWRDQCSAQDIQDQILSTTEMYLPQSDKGQAIRDKTGDRRRKRRGRGQRTASG